MLGRLFWKLVPVAIVALVAGPFLAAFVIAPREPLAAWPVWCLSFVPTLFVIASATFFRTYRPLLAAPHALSAGAWLVQTLDRLGRIGISVGVSEQGGNFYHPASRTIALSENVHDEHTARAYATAAHELGHALFHLERPRLSQLLLAARGFANPAYGYGVALLFGTVITDAASLRWLAFALVAAAVVLQALVVVDEAIASAMAGDLLRDHLDDREQIAAARGHLRCALATYASRLVAYVVPLVAAPWILGELGGVVPPGDPLGGLGRTVASAGAVASVLGAVAAVVFMMRGPRPEGIGAAVVLLFTACWLPLFYVLVGDQAAMPRWTVALATVPAWLILMTPLASIVRRFGGALTTDVDVLPWPIPTPGGLRRGPGASPLRAISMKDLRAKQEPRGPLTYALGLTFYVWAVPLALAWLLG